MKLRCDLLRDPALDGEQLIYIALVFFSPDVSSSARIDQLDVQKDFACIPADAPLQHMRDVQGLRDLLRTVRTEICNDAGAADDLEVSHPGQLGQNAVLDAIGKKRAFVFWAEIFKGQHGNSRCSARRGKW